MDQLLMVTSRQGPCQDPESNLRALGGLGDRELKRLHLALLHPDCPELPWLGLPSAPGALVGNVCISCPEVTKGGWHSRLPLE